MEVALHTLFRGRARVIHVFYMQALMPCGSDVAKIPASGRAFTHVCIALLTFLRAAVRRSDSLVSLHCDLAVQADAVLFQGQLVDAPNVRGRHALTLRASDVSAKMLTFLVAVLVLNSLLEVGRSVADAYWDRGVQA